MPFANPLIAAYCLVVAGLLGLVMGSFINCWAWRSTHGESIVSGRSHCPACNHDLGARDLVPVVSWLVSGRKCRYCGQPVSARYPVTEAVCAAVFMAIVAVYGLSLETVELILFSCVLLFLSLTDIDSYIIPNGCIIVAFVVRAAYLAAAFLLGQVDADAILYYVLSGLGVGIALLVVILVADKLFGRESMGGGDLKLYAVAGFYFGWQLSLFLVIVSCVIGIVVALVGMRGRAAGAGAGAEGDAADGPAPDGPAADEGIMKRAIPFGPSIAAACVVTMLVGKPFIAWYLSFL